MPDPLQSFDRVYLLEVPESRQYLIPELCKLFKWEQGVYRVIIAGHDGEHFNSTRYDAKRTSKTDEEFERLFQLFHSHVFPK